MKRLLQTNEKASGTMWPKGIVNKLEQTKSSIYTYSSVMKASNIYKLDRCNECMTYENNTDVNKCIVMTLRIFSKRIYTRILWFDVNTKSNTISEVSPNEVVWYLVRRLSHPQCILKATTSHGILNFINTIHCATTKSESPSSGNQPWHHDTKDILTAAVVDIIIRKKYINSNIFVES